MSNAKLWTKDFMLITLAKTFSSMVFSMLTTTMAAYSFAVYNSSTSVAGVVVGIFIIGALISRIFAGRYTEVIGRKRLLVSGSVLYFLATFAYYLPVGLTGFLLIRLFHGVAFGVASNTTTVVATGYIPRDRYGEGIAFFSLSTTMSAALGPFLGIIILQNYDHAILFAACSVLSALSLLAVCMLRVEEIVLSDKERAEQGKGLHFKDYFEMKAVPMSGINFCLTVCYASVTSFINPYTEEVGIGQYAPMFFIAYSGVMLFFRPLLGKVMDRRGANAVAYPSLICYVLGLVALSQWHSAIGLVVSAALLAIGYGCTFTCFQTIVTKAAPAHRIGLATSTFYVFTDGGQGLGPALLGSAVPLVGYSGMYIMAAAVIVGAIALYTVVYGRSATRVPKGSGMMPLIKRRAGKAGDDFADAKNAVITISRENGTGGREIGVLLSQRLGVEFYGRDEMAQVAEELGVVGDFAMQMEDQASSSLAYSHYLSSSEAGRSRKAQSAVLKEIASRGSCVIVGPAADDTFTEVDDIVRVFLYAPLEYRVSRIMGLSGESRQAALQHIARYDRARKSHFEFITGERWRDFRNYDLSFDSSIGVEESADLIAAFVRSRP
ncbi:MAG: MFS transporter [Eggerthellaceae bacterium]|nr:MFS transporter [Eggerthellaceae bacterium]